MGLYNMLFGQNPLSPAVLGLVDLDQQAVGRFRDCWVERRAGGYVVCVYTRNGGGNRDHYSDTQAAGTTCTCTGCIATYRLPAHPLYLGDDDEEDDQTYATFEFRVPKEREGLAEGLVTEPEDRLPEEKWKQLFELFEKHPEDPQVQQIMRRMDPVLQRLKLAVDEVTDEQYDAPEKRGKYKDRLK